jgi:hypothetical protein
MKPRKLKTALPCTPDEWLEYQEHRERWTPEAQAKADKFLKETFPLTDEDAEVVKNIRKHLATSHQKKPSSP